MLQLHLNDQQFYCQGASYIRGLTIHISFRRFDIRKVSVNSTSLHENKYMYVKGLVQTQESLVLLSSEETTCNCVFTKYYLTKEREREIKFIGLFEDRGHRGPYSPYKPFNHNLYMGIIIFPHIDNPQSTGYN